MANIKDRSASFIDRLLRFDHIFDGWLKRHLPLVHRFNHLAADWLSRPHPHSTSRSILLSGITVLILLILVYWLGR